MGCSVQKQPSQEKLILDLLNDKEIIEIRDQVIKEDQNFYFINTNNFKTFLDFDDGKYAGEVRENKKEGVGEYVSYIDAHDCGILNKKIKDYYLGLWKNDMRDGYGMMVYKNGNSYDYYVGEFQLNQRHGLGCIKYSNGQQYKGQFENDVFHGKGKFILQDQVTYFDGDWIYNERNGIGHEYCGDENKKWEYQGQFSKGKRQGKGKLIIHEEYEIEGEFENDFPKNVTILYKQKEFQDYKYEGYLAINDKQEAIYEGMGKISVKDNCIMEGEFSQHKYKETEILAK